jgi:hypothetical protein
MAKEKIVTLDNLKNYHKNIIELINSIEGGSSNLDDYATKTEVEDAINTAIYNALNTPI